MSRYSYPFSIVPGPKRKPLRGVTIILLALLTIIGVPFCLTLYSVTDLEGEYYLWFRLAGIVFFLLFAPIAKSIIKSGYGMLVPDAFTILERDQRPPVLFLRSFEDDRLLDIDTTGLTQYGAFTQEMKLASILGKIGPVIAIGRPGEKFPERGAARFYVPDDQWRTAVQFFMQKAAVVVFIIGLSPGILWEVKTALRNCQSDRLLFYFPFPYKLEKTSKWRNYWGEIGGIGITEKDLLGIQRNRQERYNLLRSATQDMWGVKLPPELGLNIFLHFIARDEPRLLRLRRPPVLFAPAQLHITNFDLQRTLLPFLDKITGYKTKPSRFVNFYANRNALILSMVLLLLATASFYIFTWDMTWDDPGIVLVSVLRLLVWLPIAFILYHLWLNIRYHDFG